VRILVTGGNRFIGSHVTERLIGAGHTPRLLLRRTSSLEFLAGLDFERAPGDVRDADSLLAAAKGVDAVIHLAGLTTALNEAQYQAVNALGTASMVQAAKSAGVKRFVYISSLAAQGPNDHAGRPPVTPRPVSSYGRAKLAGEWAALAEKQTMSVAIIRPPVVYGPRDRALMPLYRLAKLGVLPLFDDGMKQVSTIHVHDLADAIVLATVGESASGNVYTVADGPGHSWRDLVEAFSAAWGRRPLLLNTPPALYMLAGYAAGLAATVSRRALPLSPEEVRHMREPFWTCDSVAFTRDFGWQPRLDIAAGMAETVRWYREHRWL
jgi:nucleoside-diphosphate-sugar epimerase